MKVTSLKDMDSYIYSTVILPLKDLGVEGFSILSPMVDDEGEAFELSLGRESIGNRSFENNYLRDDARQNALHLIWLRTYRTRYIIGDFDSKRHKLRLYQRPEISKILFNKLTEAFHNYTPYTKVTISNERRDEYVQTEGLHDD